jgi:hypothetical protein
VADPTDPNILYIGTPNGSIRRSGVSLAAVFEGEFSDTMRSYAGKGVARYMW